MSISSITQGMANLHLDSDGERPRRIRQRVSVETPISRPRRAPAQRKRLQVANEGPIRKAEPRRSKSSTRPPSWEIPMDLRINSQSNVVTAIFELPGLEKEDIYIQAFMERSCLYIRARSKLPNELDSDGYKIRERRYGEFSRISPMPRGIKEDEIKARFANGILTVTFPYSAPNMTPKRIPIS
uniref:SHSP domain-containing protein n=1 Tax=Mycena chlorophos TaxID=658473 RepID=A0ABQ0LW86_MYCCL|nr:predicted protein [Mycena chlorophos]